MTAASGRPSAAETLAWKPERPTFRPMRLLVAWLVAGAAVFVAAGLTPHVSVDGFWGAVFVALQGHREHPCIGLEPHHVLGSPPVARPAPGPACIEAKLPPLRLPGALLAAAVRERTGEPALDGGAGQALRSRSDGVDPRRLEDDVGRDRGAGQQPVGLRGADVLCALRGHARQDGLRREGLPSAGAQHINGIQGRRESGSVVFGPDVPEAEGMAGKLDYEPVEFHVTAPFASARPARVPPRPSSTSAHNPNGA